VRPAADGHEEPSERPALSAAIIIPARYQSTRFPGKPLALIAGRSMLARTWARCCEAMGPDRVWVATDDDRIVDHAAAEGMQTIITSSTCLTGTDRVAEAARSIDADVYVNVQGDEPLVEPADIRRVADAAGDHPGAVINAMTEIDREDDFRSSSVPKVLAAPDGRLLYMSRGAVPTDKALGYQRAWRQVCIYAFTAASLEAFVSVPAKTPLEEIEDIEILRFLELGIPVWMVHASSTSLAVDHPADIERVEAALRESGERDR
jgi:3-deoxy-manno-octulosonate cytidylyltransferase (CMP-KDO synthetase)